jgi:hypothetical protein
MQVEQRIREHCAPQLRAFLRNVVCDGRQAAHDRVVAYIHKTLEGFLQSNLSEREAFHSANSTITHCPAKQWHGGQRGDTPTGLPRVAGTFYTDCTRRVWALFEAGGMPHHKHMEHMAHVALCVQGSC